MCLLLAACGCMHVDVAMIDDLYGRLLACVMEHFDGDIGEHCGPRRIMHATPQAELVRRLVGDGVRVLSVAMRLPGQRCYGVLELFESLAEDAALESSDEDPARAHKHL